MAASSNPEFQQLFAAYTNRDLTREEQARLRELSGSDLARRAALAEVDALHDLLAEERDLRDHAAAPVDAVEAGDEGFLRLQRAAARAEGGLRERLDEAVVLPRTAPGAAAPDPVRESRRIWLMVAAALFLLALVLRFLPEGNPALDPSTPDQAKVLGGPDILLTTDVRADEPVLFWGAVSGARRYRAEVVDPAGAVVLERAEALARENQWRLSAAEFADLAGRNQLFLRVVALDGEGGELARTRRSQPLRFRR